MKTADNDVLQTIHQIGHENGVIMLLAVDQGSCEWGYANDKSDKDVRAIYIHRPEWYLSLAEGRSETIAERFPAGSRGNKAEIDFVGFDARKAMRHFYKGNAQIVEWITARHTYYDYGDDAHGSIQDAFTGLMQRCGFYNARAFFEHHKQRSKSHYLNWIIHQGAVSVKKYLTILRSAATARYVLWFDGKEIAPHYLSILLEYSCGTSSAPGFVGRAQELIDLKQGSELDDPTTPRIPELDSYIEETWTLDGSNLPVGDPDMLILDELFRTFLRIAWSEE